MTRKFGEMRAKRALDIAHQLFGLCFSKVMLRGVEYAFGRIAGVAADYKRSLSQSILVERSSNSQTETDASISSRDYCSLCNRYLLGRLPSREKAKRPFIAQG